MNVKALLTWVGVPLLLLFLLMGPRITRSIPPFELGVHNTVVQADSKSNTDGPRVGNCPVFPKDNVWNTPVDNLPADGKTKDYVESIGAVAKVHPDFGSSLAYGMPFTEVPAGTKPSRVTFEYRDDSDLANYPIPENAPIEGGPQSTGDRHIIFIDPRRCLLEELFDATEISPGNWKAGSGIKMDLTSNALRGADKTSADAAGLPIFPGLVRYEEVQAGEINHALRFTVPHTRASYIWPARHKASRDPSPKLPPMGTRFRLRADFDISKYSRTNQVILKALKKYGMMLADNGGAMFVSGVPDKRWDDEDLHKLGGATAADFEVVDVSEWQMLGDSARVDPLAAK